MLVVEAFSLMHKFLALCCLGSILDMEAHMSHYIYSHGAPHFPCYITTLLKFAHTHYTKTLKHIHTHAPCCASLRPHHNIHVHVPYAHMSHHLHLILLYSPQHLLPTSSALHHDNTSLWPHAMKLYCPGKGVKEHNKQIHIITSMNMYGKYAMENR